MSAFFQQRAISFNSKDDANIFRRFFSNLADSVQHKLPRPQNKFGIKTTEVYYNHILNECEDFDLHNEDFDFAKVSGIDHISATFLKDDIPVIAIYLAKIINLSIKLDTFPLKYKIAKIRPLFKKGIKTEAKNYRPISLLPLISNVTEK